MRGWLPWAVVAAAVLALATAGAAEEAPGAGGFLRVQWHVAELREPVHLKLEGYVYNASSIRVTAVRLHVVTRDGAARPVGEAWGWVFGDVPAGGRAYFAIPLETTSDSYDVDVVSFDAVANQAP